MKLTKNSPNCTSVEMNGVEVVYSYETPIIYVKYSMMEVFATSQKFSKTTSKHMNAFLNGLNPTEYKIRFLLQEEFSELLKKGGIA